MDDEYIKPSDVAKRLGVTRGAVYKWIREGKLRAVRFGTRAVRIPRTALEEFERDAIETSEKDTPENIRGFGLALALDGGY